MEQDEEGRGALRARIAENSRRINEELRAMKAVQQRMGLAMTRVSPASIFQLIALEVAGTGIGLRDRYIDTIEQYRDRFGEFVEANGGNRMTFRMGHAGGDDDSEDDDAGGGGLGDQGKPLDLREMPRFEPPALSARAAIAPTIPDLALLSLLVVACFAVAFTAFLRYDVRPG
jgi:hypothetical protein